MERHLVVITDTSTFVTKQSFQRYHLNGRYWELFYTYNSHTLRTTIFLSPRNKDFCSTYTISPDPVRLSTWPWALYVSVGRARLDRLQKRYLLDSSDHPYATIAHEQDQGTSTLVYRRWRPLEHRSSYRLGRIASNLNWWIGEDLWEVSVLSEHR